ncbi:MAG: hypothetical protein PHT07_24015 [Paludibacter sp.]|nr:hypothetical protein [Paludibacter sp.]
MKYRITTNTRPGQPTAIIVRPLNILIIKFLEGPLLNFKFCNFPKFWVLVLGRIVIASNPLEVHKAFVKAAAAKQKSQGEDNIPANLFYTDKKLKPI